MTPSASLVLLPFDPPSRVRHTRDGAPQPQAIKADGDDDDYDTTLVEVDQATRNPLAACLLRPCTGCYEYPLVLGLACPGLCCLGWPIGYLVRNV